MFPRDRLIFAAGGALAGLAAVGVGAGAVIQFGLFDATASKPHLPPVAWATHTAFIRSVEVRAPVADGVKFTSAQVAAGFAAYDHDCVACHGGPGVSRADWVQGLNPTPPYLSDAARRWRPGELYWIVGQGAKMTAMPAWAETRSDATVWNVVAFLEALPYLTADDYARLRGRAQASRPQ